VTTQVRLFEADDHIEIHTASQATGTNLVTRGIEGLFSTFVAAAHLAGQVRAPFILSNAAARFTSGLAPDGVGDACANRNIAPTCGDGACFGGETPLDCPADCTCGDGICSATGGETLANCADCRCLDGICDASEQALPDGNCGLCWQDCGGNCCGSGICDPGEEPHLDGQTLQCGCQFDCGPAGVSCCGDSVCDPTNFESFANCPFDCF
jgi:hypothetical protein